MTQAPPEIPTDEVGLIRLLEATPAGDRYAICERLEKQIVDQARARRLFERAEAEVLHGEACERLRRQLTAALDAAAAELRKAEGLLVDLCGSSVYDVEYAEGVGADDLLHMVTTAHRSARIASTLQKTIAA
ncbi:hypothetical protein [Streptomyces sp. NPDC056683]|uniref:hypothetical protein n=1 Tax=Streptomyces sp. NPDC056683 TaxID=3345910 RepID=UPI0036C5A709